MIVSVLPTMEFTQDREAAAISRKHCKQIKNLLPPVLKTTIETHNRRPEAQNEKVGRVSLGN